MLRVKNKLGTDIQELSGMVETDEDLETVAKAFDSKVYNDLETGIRYVPHTDINTDLIRSSWIVKGCWVWLEFRVQPTGESRTPEAVGTTEG